MNDSTPATGDAAAQTAILGLDLDILHAVAPTEVVAFVTHMATCAKAVSSTCMDARLPDSVAVHVTRQLNEDDGQWLESHPGRVYRYRDPMAGEYILNLCAECHPHFVLVRQLSKGARLLAPLWFEFKGPTTSLERFEAARNQKLLDSDLVLSTMFDVYCAFPGVPLDIRNLLALLADRSWLEMVRLFSAEVPAS